MIWISLEFALFYVPSSSARTIKCCYGLSDRDSNIEGASLTRSLKKIVTYFALFFGSLRLCKKTSARKSISRQDPQGPRRAKPIQDTPMKKLVCDSLPARRKIIRQTCRAHGNHGRNHRSFRRHLCAPNANSSGGERYRRANQLDRF